MPLTGIAVVGTAPEARGRGVALEMMKRCAREMHANGEALSGLYPATQRLYRLAGWEQSGHRFEIRLPLSRIGIREVELDVRSMEESDTEAVRALYASVARFQDGNLDRAPAIWNRIEYPPPTRKDRARGFVLEGENGLEGYIYLTQPLPLIPDRGKHEVVVHDMMASTPRAARRLWSMLSSYGTLANEMVWTAGPSHPMLMMLGEQPYKFSILHHWMTRVVDVKRALEGRGYSPGVRATLGLEVRDDVIEANNGQFVLEVADGVGRVSKATSMTGARVRTTVNGLAAMYTGYAPAAGLRAVGMVEGDDEGVRTAGTVFAGGAPWMTEMY